MLFEGEELRTLIAKTPSPIELRNERGQLHRTITNDEALALDLSLYFGIGNRRRIRFLRRRPGQFELNIGSRTTRRLTSTSGEHIAHPHIKQHRTWV